MEGMKRMSHIFILVLIVFLGIGPAVLCADSEDFKRGVEAEEEENRAAEDDAEQTEAENGEGEPNPFLDFLYRVTIFIWVVHNGSVYYDTYPYGPAAGNFIQYDMERSQGYWDETEATGAGGMGRVKTHWFELAAGGLYSPDWGGYDPLSLEGYGGFLSLQGRFAPYLGPDIDYRYYYDDGGELHSVGVGLDLPLVQTDPFSWSAYGKWVTWRGYMNRDGGASGFTFRSYLFAPVSLYLRAGGVFFPDITFGQVESRLNIHLGSLTVFGGINLLESEKQKNRLFSVEAGSSIYF